MGLVAVVYSSIRGESMKSQYMGVGRGLAGELISFISQKEIDKDKSVISMVSSLVLALSSCLVHLLAYFRWHITFSLHVVSLPHTSLSVLIPTLQLPVTMNSLNSWAQMTYFYPKTYLFFLFISNKNLKN